MLLMFAQSLPSAAAEDALDAEAAGIAELAEALQQRYARHHLSDDGYSFDPSILIMTTCFTRIIIVLSILRNALGLQQTPPNQVLIGTALFLTLFIMSPARANQGRGLHTYKNDEISQRKCLTAHAAAARVYAAQH